MENYKVECTHDYGDLYLSITHNGYQWTSLAIKDPEYEIPLIISELERHLTSQSGGQEREPASFIETISCPRCGYDKIKVDSRRFEPKRYLTGQFNGFGQTKTR